MHLVRFTPDYLRALREKACSSLWFFNYSLLGGKDLYWPLHGPMLEFLARDSNRKLLCAFRGSIKSWNVRGWLWWRGLHDGYDRPDRPEFSSLMVGQKYDNIKASHEKLQDLFKYGPQSGLLQELYMNPEVGEPRIPEGFSGWTSNRTVLRSKDPQTEEFCSIGALEGRLESVHRRTIVGDDLEGADAEKSDAPNEESYRFVVDRATPLMVEPAKDIKLIVGTPHGPNPLVHRLKDAPGWDVFWQPIQDSKGKSVWPVRFPDEWIALSVKEANALGRLAIRGWDTQFRLKKVAGSGFGFDAEKVADAYYRFSDDRSWVIYRALEYPEGPGREFDEPTPVVRQKKLLSLRYYIHCDTGHKGPGERKSKETPSKWAIIVVGVAEDFHKFVVDGYLERDTTFDQYITRMFTLYRKWAPYRVTWEDIGAQAWLVHHVKAIERERFQPQGGIFSLPQPWRPTPHRLPNLSARMEEVGRGSVEKKDDIMEKLEVPFNLGMLHLHPKHEALIDEVKVFGHTDDESFDGLDALSQGAPIWQPAVSKEAVAQLRSFEQWMRKVRMVEETTGYSRPFAEPGDPPVSVSL